jgi:hypothetical protein
VASHFFQELNRFSHRRKTGLTARSAWPGAFGKRTVLVHLHGSGIRGAGINVLLQELHVGHKQIAAAELKPA